MVDELDAIELLSKRWNSFEFVVNDSFFGGTLIILGIENGRLLGIPVDIEADRFNIELVVTEPSVEVDARKAVFTGVFDFYWEILKIFYLKSWS